MITKKVKDNLLFLADDARPINDYDWGSERQVKAETKLCDEVLTHLGEGIALAWEESAMSFKMDDDDIIDWIKNYISSIEEGEDQE